MENEIISWGDHVLNAGNYKAYILAGSPLVTPASGVYVERADTTPVLTGLRLSGPSISIIIKYQDELASQHEREREIKQWFQTNKQRRKVVKQKLLVRDTDDADLEWSVMASPMSVVPEGNSAIVVFAVDEPYWKIDTERMDDWHIATDSAQKTITVVGDIVKPIFEITPKDAKSTGFLHYRFVEVQPPSTVITLGKYWLDIAGVGGINTAQLIIDTKLQASGADWRVLDGNTEIPFWFGKFDQADTKIWTCLDWKPKLTFTLGTAIPASGPIDIIQLANTATNKTNIAKMPKAGIVKIGNERFTYSGIDVVKYQFTGVVRASKLTSEEIHNANVLITWIQHDLWFVYDNPVIDAPVIDNTLKPMFDLDASTNTSWVFYEFFSLISARGVEWSLNKVVSTPAKTAMFYSATQEGTAEPATDMGINVQIGLVGGVPKPETFTMYANLFCAAGFTHISSLAGKRYRQDVYWPVVQMRKSTNGSTYVAINTVATPSAPLVWTDTWSLTAQALGGNFPHLQLYVNGVLPGKVIAGVNNKINVEVNAIACTVDAANVPSVTVDAESETYWLDLTFTNKSTDEEEWLHVKGPMLLDEVLTIDCENRRAYHQDGTYWSVELSTERPEYLVCENGPTILQFDDVGTTDLDVHLRLSDRAAL